MRNAARRLAILTGLLVVLVVGASCGGGGNEAFDINKGGTEADGTVKSFIEGWALASGPTRDQFAAGQTRRFLGGELGTMVANIRTGGTSGQKPVEQVFNDIMMTPLPPDLGYEVLENSKQGETTVVSKIRLKYSVDSVNEMVKAGRIPTADAAAAFDAVKGQPIRTLTLVKGEGGWQITKVEG